MTETTQTPPVLSPATQACVQGLVRAKAEIAQWTKNLEQALADDVDATPPRLTVEQAGKIAKDNEVKAPPAPKEQPEAVETTPEANQAQLDTQTKLSEEEAAKTAPPPPKAKAKNDEKPAPAAAATHAQSQSQSRAEHR